MLMFGGRFENTVVMMADADEFFVPQVVGLVDDRAGGCGSKAGLVRGENIVVMMADADEFLVPQVIGGTAGVGLIMGERLRYLQACMQ